MKTLFLAALIALSASVRSFGAEYTFVNKLAKLIPQARLNSDLIAAGFVVVGSACLDGVTCSVTVSDKKMPAASNPAAKFAAITRAAAEPYESAESLYGKLKAGTATPAEKDRLLLLLAQLLLSNNP